MLRVFTGKPLMSYQTLFSLAGVDRSRSFPLQMNSFPAVLDEHESLAALSHQGCDVPIIHSNCFYFYLA